MAGRDLGELGESELRRWAAQIGLVVNKASNDKTAWDFIVEYPFDYSGLSTSIPLDKAPSPLRCFIQVKATDTKEKSEPIKLTNWWYMVNNPLPSFVLFLDYAGKGDCQNAYLVHIGERKIADLLKKLRTVPQKDRSKLHEKYMRLSFGVKDRLKSLNGEGLDKEIRRYVGSNPDQYSTKKIDYVKRVGYENGNIHLTVKFLPPAKYSNPQEFFVDLLIGAAEKIDVLETTVRDVRFGIEAPEPVAQISGGIITINPHVIGKGILIIKSHNNERFIRIDGDLFAPQGLPDGVDKSLFKIRFASPFLTMIMQPLIGAISTDILFPKVNTNYRIRDIAAIAEAAKFFSEHEGRENAFDLLFNDNTLASGRMKGHRAATDADLKVFDHIIFTRNILNHFALSLEVEVRIRDILQQSDSISLINHLIGQDRYIRISFLSQEEIEDTRDACVPFTVSCVIGHSTIILGMAVTGPLQKTGEIVNGNIEYQVTSEKPAIHRTGIYDANSDASVIFTEFEQDIAHAHETTHQIITLTFS